MIRSALIALGLSAGAAGAQVMVPSAPELDTCGGTVELVSLDKTAGAADGMPVVVQADDPSLDDILDDIAAPAVSVRFTQDAGQLSGSVTTADAEQLAALMHSGVLPFDLDVLSKDSVDGSDPSADFCP
ncbi:MAG: hypothetical protein ABF254_10215 [Octadecabacter sp.]